MGLNKILKKLGNLMDGNKTPKEENCDEIRELLEKLKKKRDKLVNKISTEDSSSKRKALKLDLKITTEELKKGTRLLRKKCD